MKCEIGNGSFATMCGETFTIHEKVNQATKHVDARVGRDAPGHVSMAFSRCGTLIALNTMIFNLVFQDRDQPSSFDPDH